MKNAQWNAASYIPQTLKHALKKGPLPLPACLSIAQSLATALDHLHSHGLVHRDIKPSNIIFVNGRPKLADIGLVTSTDATRSFVGTDGYIPPEGPGTPQADLYSLGKVLYECVTGKDRSEFPELPDDWRGHSDFNRLLEFNEIITKACDNDPRARYSDARSLTDDLAVLGAGESLKRKRTHAARRSTLKHRVLVFTLIVLPACVIAFLAHFNSLPGRSSEPLAFPQTVVSRDHKANQEFGEGWVWLRKSTADGMKKAWDHFNRARELDPNCAAAYDGLFEVLVDVLSCPATWRVPRDEAALQMRAAVNTLMALGSNRGEAHAAQAWVDYLDWNWAKAEAAFKTAIKLSPDCAIAHMRYGWFLLFTGNTSEGSEQILIAETLDPALPRIKKNVGQAFYVKRDYSHAIAHYQEVLDLYPDYSVSHSGLGYCYRAQGDYLKAIDQYEQYEIAMGKNPVDVHKHFGDLRIGYESNGRSGYWTVQLRNAQNEADVYSQAEAWAHLEDYPRALDLLEKAYSGHEKFVKTHPGAFFEACTENLFYDECWDKVRNDPKFLAILEMIGLTKFNAHRASAR